MTRPPPPQVQYVFTSDGVRIAYYVVGQGPPVVNLPGWPFQHLHEEWKRFWGRGIDYYSQFCTMVRFDGRACGMSQRDVSNFSLDARMLDMDAVVERTIQGQFDILAVSHSVPLAIAYAVRHPERVRKMILASGSARGRDLLTPQIEAMLPLMRADWELYTESTVGHIWSFGSEEAREVAAYLRVCVDDGNAAAETLKAKMDVDVTALLPEIKAKTLVILYQGDRFPSLDVASQMVSQIPDAQLLVDEGRSIDLGADVMAAQRAFLTDEAVVVVGNAAPSAFRTVLFTDLVGHTEMMSRLGDDRGRDVLREHERITREVLKANGGTEVKTMGDGFMASFGSVTKAVECAVALQRAFAERNRGVGTRPPDVGARRPFSRDDAASDIDASSSERDFANRNASPQTPPSTSNASPSPRPVEPLSVRVGLNAGEPIEEDGDLFGATVILASRIAAKADGGEIMVADTVRGLCSGKGFLFSDRGDFVAKGFEEPVRISEVNWRS